LTGEILHIAPLGAPFRMTGAWQFPFADERAEVLVNVDEARVRAIVEQVVKSIATDGSAPAQSAPSGNGEGVTPEPIALGDGIFATAGEAVEATAKAQRAWVALSLEARKKVVDAVRSVAHENAETFARETVAETGMGRYADKVVKHHLVADYTPGFEDLETRAWSGDHGLTVEEMAPYGVVAAVTPSTHPAPTMFNNTICNLAAGNGVVYNGHPGGKRVFAHAVKLTTRAIVAAGGPENIISAVGDPTIESANELFTHPKVNLILVTGGPGVVKAAMKTGKKVIAAGPGNPPVVVDETADLEKAAKSIISGATFDCNILCTAEKEIFVVDSVADELKRHMVANGSYELTTAEVEKLADYVFSGEASAAHPKLNRNAVGNDAEKLAEIIGVKVPPTTRLLIGETSKTHAFVQHEQMTSFLPVVRCTDVHQAIEWALEAEHEFHHTAIMHSKNVENMDKMARLCGTTLFVKNGPSGSGNGGPDGEGTLGFSIAGTTGEGICTPRTFTRLRRCALVDYFRII